MSKCRIIDEQVRIKDKAHHKKELILQQNGQHMKPWINHTKRIVMWKILFDKIDIYFLCV